MAFRRIFTAAVLLAVLLAVFCAPVFAEGEASEGAPEAREEGQFPELNGDGFLDSGEFVFEDEENGVWRYASETLWIEIYRREQAKPARVWYEAEIRCAEGSEGPRMIAEDPDHWMSRKEYPYKIARKTGTVLGVSSDYAQLRLEKKNNRPGIIIRDGTVYGKRTRPKNSKGFPNLDCLAIWPDGDMQVFYSDEKTAEQYLEEGAVDVLAFGPILIRDGELNEEALNQQGGARRGRHGGKRALLFHDAGRPDQTQQGRYDPLPGGEAAGQGLHAGVQPGRRADGQHRVHGASVVPDEGQHEARVVAGEQRYPGSRPFRPAACGRRSVVIC